MKKLLSLFLAAALVMCGLPVFAAENGTDDYSEAISELIKYNLVVPDEDGELRLDEPLTVMDCLENICRYVEGYPDDDYLSEEWLKANKSDVDRIWSYFEEEYNGQYIFTDLTEKQKAIIGKLGYVSNIFVLGEYYTVDSGTLENHTVPSEWLSLDINGLCTESQAVLYMARAVTDTYGCGRSYSDYAYTTEESYIEASDKCIIDSADTSNADKIITRGVFFEMFCRMLNAEYDSGGVGGVKKVKNIDFVKRQYDNKTGATPMPHNLKTDNEVETLPKANDDAENEAVPESDVRPYDRWASRGAFEEFPETPSDDTVIDRGEFAVVLSNIMGYSHNYYDSVDDMPKDWRWDGLHTLNYYNIMTGYDGHIEPDREVTPEEAYAMFARAFYIDQTDTLNPTVAASGISEWAIPIVSAMYDLGYLTEVDLGKTTFTYNDMFEIMDRLAPYYYGKEFRYGTDEIRYYNGNVIINSSLMFENAVINGNLYLSDLTGQEYLKLKNVTVNGTLYIDGLAEIQPYLMGCSARGVAEKKFSGLTSGSNNLYLENLDGSEFIVAAGKNPVIHDDMSISWDYPDNMLGVDALGIIPVDENGEKIGSLTYSFIDKQLSRDEVISALQYCQPKKASKFLITYKPLVGGADEMEIDVSALSLPE